MSEKKRNVIANSFLSGSTLAPLFGSKLKTKHTLLTSIYLLPCMVIEILFSLYGHRNFILEVKLVLIKK